MRDICAILLACSLLGQTKPAANAWMKEPTEVTAPDPVPPAVRKAREDYIDTSQIASREPLTRFNVGNSGISEGSYLGPQPEIPNLPKRAVLIGWQRQA